MGAQKHNCPSCQCAPPLCRAGQDVRDELIRARRLFPRNSASAHEAFAVLKEEVDELWDEVRGKTTGFQSERRLRMRKEAVQVAAMAIRFIEEVCDV